MRKILPPPEVFDEIAERYFIFGKSATVVLLSRASFAAGTAAELADAAWRVPLEAAGEAAYGAPPPPADGATGSEKAAADKAAEAALKLRKDWTSNVGRTVAVRARLCHTRWNALGARASDEPAAPPAADELGPVVVIASIHGKASAAIEAFVPALKDALAAAAPDAATFALGMDSNAPDASFRAALERAGLSFELAGAPERRTVCKRRTAFQTQAKKAGSLDNTMKDFICAWSGGGAAPLPSLRPIIGRTECVRDPKRRRAARTTTVCRVPSVPFVAACRRAARRAAFRRGFVSSIAHAPVAPTRKGAL